MIHLHVQMQTETHRIVVINMSYWVNQAAVLHERQRERERVIAARFEASPVPACFSTATCIDGEPTVAIELNMRLFVSPSNEFFVVGLSKCTNEIILAWP